MFVSAPRGYAVATPCIRAVQRQRQTPKLPRHIQTRPSSAGTVTARCCVRGAVSFVTDSRNQSRRERALAGSGGWRNGVWRVSRVSRVSDVSRGGGCVAAFSERGDNVRDKWRSICRKVEAELPSERQVLRRIIGWVGENPVAALVTAVATACTAGAVASALALQLAFSGLSIVLPAVLFATVGASTFLFFGSLILFGFILPSAGFMVFAAGGTALATLSAVAPVICFAVAAVVGARVMDSLLPSPEAEGVDVNVDADEGGNRSRNRNSDKSSSQSSPSWSQSKASEVVDQDLADFDKRLYGDAATWSPGGGTFGGKNGSGGAGRRR